MLGQIVEQGFAENRTGWGESIEIWVLVFGIWLAIFLALVLVVGVPLWFLSGWLIKRLGRQTTKRGRAAFALGICFLLSILISSFLQVAHQDPQPPQYSSLSELITGRVAYQIDSTMEIDQSYTSTLAITRAVDDSLMFRYKSPENWSTDTIKVSPRMKAILIDPRGGNSFQISSLNSEEQVVDGTTATVWRWAIQPMQPGIRKLIVRLSVQLSSEDGEMAYRDLNLIEKEVIIDAPWSFQIKTIVRENWQYLLSAVVIPAFALGYRRLRTRKRLMKS